VAFIRTQCDTACCQLTVFIALRKPGKVMQTKYRQTAKFMDYS